MVSGCQRTYGEEQGQETKEAATMMTPKKEDGRTRRKTGAGRGDSERVGRTVEKAASEARDVTMVDVDPWGSFFDKIWGQALEGESVDRQDIGPKPTKAARTPDTKPGRQGRSPRAT
jgi:hypothetical protein